MRMGLVLAVLVVTSGCSFEDGLKKWCEHRQELLECFDLDGGLGERPTLLVVDTAQNEAFAGDCVPLRVRLLNESMNLKLTLEDFPVILSTSPSGLSLFQDPGCQLAIAHTDAGATLRVWDGDGGADFYVRSTSGGSTWFGTFDVEANLFDAGLSKNSSLLVFAQGIPIPASLSVVDAGRPDAGTGCVSGLSISFEARARDGGPALPAADTFVTVHSGGVSMLKQNSSSNTCEENLKDSDTFGWTANQPTASGSLDLAPFGLSTTADSALSLSSPYLHFDGGISLR